jgi:DNA-binding MarR family transcriptional regulator
MRPEGVAPLALGALSDLLGFHLARAAAVTVELFERHVGAPLQLRKVEYSLLLLLQANGPLAPKRLLQALALSAPNLSLVIDRLEQRALVRRERSETDRRSQNIVLTDTGRALAARGAEAAPAMEQEMLHCLSPAERLMLMELLRKVSSR